MNSLCEPTDPHTCKMGTDATQPTLLILWRLQIMSLNWKTGSRWSIRHTHRSYFRLPIQAPNCLWVISSLSVSQDREARRGWWIQYAVQRQRFPVILHGGPCHLGEGGEAVRPPHQRDPEALSGNGCSLRLPGRPQSCTQFWLEWVLLMGMLTAQEVWWWGAVWGHVACNRMLLFHRASRFRFRALPSYHLTRAHPFSLPWFSGELRFKK